MRLQLLGYARCRTAFIFTRARVERAAGGKLAVCHEDCSAAQNEIVQRQDAEWFRAVPGCRRSRDGALRDMVHMQGAF
jgi:hypothetical protein